MKIGVVQVSVGADKEKNFSKCHDFILNAKSQGAKMIFLPEAFDFLAPSAKETSDLAEPVDGPLISRYRALAKEEDIWLSLGGFHRKDREADLKVSNCHLVLDDSGSVVGAYNKAHLFDIDVPGRVTLTESRYVQAGQAIHPVLQTPVGRLGLAVCYDMRFSELALCLREDGAEILSYPSAFSVPTGKAEHWEVLLRSRAIETQCWVVAAAQCGQHNDKRASYGHSMVVDPWGRVLVDLGSAEEGVAVVSLEHKELERVRRNMPVMQHRRFDLYPSMMLCGSAPDGSETFQFGPHTIPGSHAFYRSPLSFAFVNLSPVVRGHVLVAPLRPAVRLADLSEAEVCDLYRTAHRLLAKLEQHYGTSSLTLACQDGPDAGQTVEHVHLHILPRRKGDFEVNDAIYEQLEERGQYRVRERRTNEEMTAEAKELRDLFFGPQKED